MAFVKWLKGLLGLEPSRDKTQNRVSQEDVPPRRETATRPEEDRADFRKQPQEQQAAAGTRHDDGTTVVGDFVLENRGRTLVYYTGQGLDVVVPEGVTELAEMAFFMSRVRTVVLPDGLRKIGSRCFWDSIFLDSIVLPDTLEEIDNEAFRTCPRLDDLEIPRSVKRIGAGAFYGCRMTAVTFAGTEEEWDEIDMEDGAVEGPNGVVMFSDAEALAPILECVGDYEDDDEEYNPYCDDDK